MEPQTIDREQLSEFEAAFRGTVIRPTDSDFDEARAVWNGIIDKSPALIARCAGVVDVINAVDFAREHGILVSVRGGGHNVAGTAICDDGIVIDLSEMRSVRVDPLGRTARVQAGATWADVDHETQAFGLATPGGVVSDTGVAGLTLGGGIGHLRCKYGLSCDNLVSVDLVTAAGDYLSASEDENADLFWALRGGGGNFGIITSFQFELHEIGPEVATCLVFYPSDQLVACLQSYREYVESSPEEVSTLVFAGELPDEEAFEGDDIHRQKFAILGCYAGPVDEGREALSPLRELTETIADFSGEMSYTHLQQILDEDYPDGMRYYWKSLYVDDLSDSAVDRIAYWAEVAPSPLSTVDVWELGGAITRVDQEDSAFAGRHAPFLLGVEANWIHPADDEDNIEWVRDCLADMRQFSDGSFYLNFPGFLEAGEDAVRTTFGPAYERLTELKDKYDPSNFFSLNQNILPSEHLRDNGVTTTDE